MKQRVAFLLLIALLGAVLYSCNSAEPNGNGETTTEPITTEAPLEWNEQTQNMVKQTYLDWIRGSSVYKNATLEDVIIENCNGIYNNAVAVEVYGSHDYFLYWETYETVDGVEFSYPDSGYIRVWKDHAFYRLQEAFDQGFLTHDDLVQIADRYYETRN